MRAALAGAVGFLAGVVLVAVLADVQPEAPTATVTVTTPGGSATVVRRVVVPDVRGEPLDRALERISRAGFEADVQGGGLFGVLDEDNWEVVDQTPSGGFLEQGALVRLEIDRR